MAKKKVTPPEGKKKKSADSVKSNSKSNTKSTGKRPNSKRATQTKCKTKPPPSKPRPRSPESKSRKSCKSGSSTSPGPPLPTKSIGLKRDKPSSISSLASHYRNTTGRFQPNLANTSDVVADAIGDKQFNQYGQGTLYDSVLVYLHCPTHNKVALSSVGEKGQFLPYGPINVGQSWRLAAVNLIKKILKLDQKTGDDDKFQGLSMVDILRIQLPIYYEYVTRVMFKAELTKKACQDGFCKDNDAIAWFDVGKVKDSDKASEECFGPEQSMLDVLSVGKGANCREVTLYDVLLQENEKGKSLKSQLLDCCHYSEDDIVRVYGDYLQHTYPSEFMTLNTFKTYCTKAKLNLSKVESMPAVFRSFAQNSTPGYINFDEFIVGLAMVDKLNGTSTSASSESEEKSSASSKQSKDASLDNIAAEYVFRYYAKSSKADHLSEQELAKALREQQVSELDATNFKKKHLKAGKVSKTDFSKLICEVSKSKVNGFIYQACISPLRHLRTHANYPPLNLKAVARHKDREAVANRAIRRCDNCRKDYHLSTNMVKLTSAGLITEPMENEQPDAEQMSAKKRELSVRYFTEQFVCNQLVNSVRKFASTLKIYEPTGKIDAPDWIKDRAKLGDHIVIICDEAAKIFKKGPTVVQVSSPCYVIGDIHGNLRDLLIYEKLLWKLGPYMSPASFLFLGDYVDRGAWGLECIVYLLCLKLLAPDRFFMLRGNHESRDMQRAYSFYQECIAKFKDVSTKLGDKVFEALNKVFDMMPLCAVVDQSIYCAHGGIPSCADKMEQIMALKRPMADPERDSPIAHEILWNDPIHDHDYLDLATNHDLCKQSVAEYPHGYLTNTSRGTACFYSAQAMKDFMAANSLTHLIRAHECTPNGYKYHLGGRCITIFSCSYYEKEINEAAVAFVNDAKIRVIKVDTGKKEEAMLGK